MSARTVEIEAAAKADYHRQPYVLGDFPKRDAARAFANGARWERRRARRKLKGDWSNEAEQ